MIYFLDMHFFYDPGFCITRMLVMLSSGAVKVAKAFSADGGEVLQPLLPAQ